MTDGNVGKMRTGGMLLLGLVIVLVGTPVFAMSDEACMECHSDSEMVSETQGSEISLYVDYKAFSQTIHAENGCVSCHEDADVEEGEDHPVPLASVACWDCHETIGEKYKESQHGQARMVSEDMEAPECYNCHTKHRILPPTDPRSSTYPLNIPTTCGNCHHEGSQVTKDHKFPESNIVQKYSMSIHGKGLYEDGLIVTAVCSSCHTPHSVFGPNDPRSSVNRKNIVQTCNRCHVGIVNTFLKSVHSPLITRTDKKLPICIDCHTSHNISRVQERDFRLMIAGQCSNCHAHESESFLETYHGRAGLLLGGEKTAKCSDCHGSHNIMPVASEKSMISPENIVKTCSACHPKANIGFTAYLAHGTHNNREKYPMLFYTFWGMTGLLVGTFSFFGIHTLLWVPRSFIERLKMRGKG